VKTLLLLLITGVGSYAYLIDYRLELIRQEQVHFYTILTEFRRDLTNLDKAQVSDHQRQQEDILLINQDCHRIVAWLKRVDDDLDPGYLAMLETMIRKLQNDLLHR
jgi:hypothetical protein